MQEVQTAFFSSMTDILVLVLTVVIPVLAAFGIKLLKDFIQDKSKLLKNQYANNLIYHAASTLEDIVNQTTQTYVAALKADGKFDLNAQKAALGKSLATAKDLLSAEAKDVIIQTHGDLDKWITTQVESIVAQHGVQTQS